MESEAPSRTSSESEVFRRFNRIYTRFIGTLNETLLATDYSLAEGRVLYELATRFAPTASEIAEELGMDAGYLSRLLGKFEREGLLRRKTSTHDGRYAELKLSPHGKVAFKMLNALSEEQARTVLAKLAPAARTELIRCMQTIEKIVTTDERRPACVLRPHRIGDMGWIVYREGAGYAEQYGWNQDFEVLVLKIVHEFVTNFDPVRERCWIAELDGQHVGHIFLVKHPADPEIAKLRLLFVEPSARGRGIGDTLVNECVCFARTAAYRKVVLWTQSILLAAHRIYEQAGFRVLKEEPHHSFGCDLIGQEWELDLAVSSTVR
jgi:DNA-binding MarR family transcriptional regulator/GNAT superfamily N-acetyltransferase